MVSVMKWPENSRTVCLTAAKEFLKAILGKEKSINNLKARTTRKSITAVLTQGK